MKFYSSFFFQFNKTRQGHDKEMMREEEVFILDGCMDGIFFEIPMNDDILFMLRFPFTNKAQQFGRRHTSIALRRAK